MTRSTSTLMTVRLCQKTAAGDEPARIGISIVVSTLCIVEGGRRVFEIWIYDVLVGCGEGRSSCVVTESIVGSIVGDRRNPREALVSSNFLGDSEARIVA